MARGGSNPGDGYRHARSGGFPLAAAHALRRTVGYAFAYPERAAFERTERVLQGS